jgi:hypothetical protein
MFSKQFMACLDRSGIDLRTDSWLEEDNMKMLEVQGEAATNKAAS